MSLSVRFCSVVAVLAVAFPSAKAAANQSLSAEKIMDRAVARAQSSLTNTLRGEYTFSKATVSETLDGRGDVKERKEKVYLIESGKAYLQEMKVNGENVSAAELAKEERLTAQARKEATDSKSSQRDENWEKFLTPDLIAKYDFELVGTETVNGRRAYVLVFEPVSEDLPVRNMADRVLNRLAGKLWVDAGEFEIARARISLQSQATLGGLLKMIGALKRFTYSMDRVRIAENVWFNSTTQGDFESRKLWDSNRIRTRTESTGFQKQHTARNDSE